MEKLTRERVEQILGDRACESELTCIDQDPEEMCRVMDIGQASYMICLEEDAKCSFSVTPFSEGNDENWWCTCPVRMYIAREYTK